MTTGPAPLKPLTCDACGAAVPLSEAPRRPCPFCQAEVVSPPDYLEAVAMRREAIAARKAAEPRWRQVAAGSSPWWGLMGGTLMVLGPPIATACGLSLEPAQTTAQIFSFFTLPALFPGSILFVWGASADATKLSFQGALEACPPNKTGAPPGCRRCGAPLEVGTEDLSATCLYCGTDSFLSKIPLATISADLSDAMLTLDQATRALFLRLWLVRLALVGTAVVLTGLAYALWAMQQSLV